MRVRKEKTTTGEIVYFPADDPRGALHTRSAAPPVDPCLALVARGREALPELGPLRAPADAALTALARCRTIALSLPDRAADAIARARGDIERGAEISRRSAGTQEEADAAARRFTATRETEIADGVAGEFADDARAAGGHAVLACTTFDEALARLGLDAEQAFYSGAPRDLAGTVHEASEAERWELAGAAALKKTIDARLAIGDTDEADRLLRISANALTRLTRTPRPKIATGAARETGRPSGSVDADLEAAYALLRLIRVRQHARKPPELATGTGFRESILLPAFTLAVGASAWSMSTRDFRAILDGQARPPTGAWQLDPGWYRRELASAPRWGDAAGSLGARLR